MHGTFAQEELSSSPSVNSSRDEDKLGIERHKSLAQLQLHREGHDHAQNASAS